MNNISVSDQLLAIFVFVDDYLKQHPTIAHWRRSPNAHPGFTDAEVITIDLMQGVFGCQTLNRAYLLVVSLFRDAFSKHCSYKEGLRRLHELTGIVGRLMQAALRGGALLADRGYRSS